MKEKFTIVFQPYGRRITVSEDTNLLEAARSAGITLRSVCGGKGGCGKCKIIIQKGEVQFNYDPKEKLLTDEELNDGYVLACLSFPKSDCEVFIPPETRLEGQKIQMEAKIPKIIPEPVVKKVFIKPTQLEERAGNQLEKILHLVGVESFPSHVEEKLKAMPTCCPEGATIVIRRYKGEVEVLGLEEGNTTDRLFGLAVDIGTTKVVAYLVDLITGEVLGYESSYNKQLMYGEDVVSRIGYTMEKEDGRKKVQKAVVDTINELISRLTSKHQVGKDEIVDVCAAGNTVMTYLFAGIDASPLLDPGAKIPVNSITLDSKSVGLYVHESAKIYCLPCVSRFFGGDAIGDILVSGMHKSPKISLLVDIGTNVEAVLGCESWFVTTTAAAGPAFEGWGIRFGTRAIEGAIDHVKIDPVTLKAEYTVIGDAKPKGICGSGLIDLLSEMFRNGMVDSLGKINTELKTPLIREGIDGYEYVVVPAEETAIEKDIVITEKDIANLIDSKAAACSAIGILLKKMRLSVYDVEQVFICGAFGNYLDVNSAIAIGLIPEFPNARITYLGNGSVAGAYLTLVSAKYRYEAEEIAKLTTYFDLLKDPDFMDEYTAAYFLPGKKELFPTWWAASRKIKRS